MKRAVVTAFVVGFVLGSRAIAVEFLAAIIIRTATNPRHLGDQEHRSGRFACVALPQVAPELGDGEL